MASARFTVAKWPTARQSRIGWWLLALPWLATPILALIVPMHERIDREDRL